MMCLGIVWCHTRHCRDSARVGTHGVDRRDKRERNWRKPPSEETEILDAVAEKNGGTSKKHFSKRRKNAIPSNIYKEFIFMVLLHGISIGTFVYSFRRSMRGQGF
jgi:hypothetical protein